jgi:hypothetical protein
MNESKCDKYFRIIINFTERAVSVQQVNIILRYFEMEK